MLLAPVLLALIPAALAGQVGRRGLLKHAEIKARQAEMATAARNVAYEQVKRNNNTAFRFRNDETERE